MKKITQYKVTLIIVCLSALTMSCSTFWGEDKQFINQTVGAAEIIHDTFSDKVEGGACQSGTKEEKARCQKEVDEMSKAMKKKQ